MEQVVSAECQDYLEHEGETGSRTEGMYLVIDYSSLFSIKNSRSLVALALAE